MSILFKTKDEVGLTLKTSVLVGGKIRHIYNFFQNGCNKYFMVQENVRIIGYIFNKTFYVVNIGDENFDEGLKQHVSIIDNTYVELLSKPHTTLTATENKQIREKKGILRKIPNFKYIELEFYHCHHNIDLTNAKYELNNLNELWKCSNYTLKLDYVFEMENDTEINARESSSTTLLLCIYNESKCVSSLVIKYDSQSNDIMIESKTKNEFEGKSMNKLLRAVIILLSKHLFPSAVGIVSTAINATSAYIMIKHFNAIPSEDINAIVNTYKNIATYVNDNGGIETRVILNDPNIENANQKFIEITKKYLCNTGGKKTRKRGKTKRSVKKRKGSLRKKRKNKHKI